MSEIIWYLPFSHWLISLSIMLSRSIHAVTNKEHITFFLLKYYYCLLKYYYFLNRFMGAMRLREVKQVAQGHSQKAGKLPQV